MKCPHCLKAVRIEREVFNAADFVSINPGAFLREGVWVSITKPFLMQKTQVTQDQWKAVMGNSPSRFKDCGDDCPVENVSWNDTQEFIRKLNEMEGKEIYRLPTEAEWEYACRAGSDSLYCFGDDESLLTEYAWYGMHLSGTRPVGTKKPNAWGLYDMHGNVWEWCNDWFGDYPSGREINPEGPSEGSLCALRGGSWCYDARHCRSAYRDWNAPDYRYDCIGLRLVKTDPKGPEEGSYRVLRGGGWNIDAQYCRCAHRGGGSPGSHYDSFGFRLVKEEINPEGPEEGSGRVLRGGSWYYYARACRSATRLRGAPDSRAGHIGFRLVKEEI